MKTTSIHPTSIVSTTNIGDGTRIWAFVNILEGAKIGEQTNICDHCFIENDVVIGDNVTIKCGVWLWDGVTIEDDVFVGPSVTFTNDLFPRSGNTNFIRHSTLLKLGCSIGANSTILPGITIGRYAMVGAGSVVTKDVGDYELVVGNPARISGYVCICGQRLSFDFPDTKSNCDCGRSYSKNESVIQQE